MERTLADAVSRRRLLKVGVSLLAVSVIAGCSPQEGGAVSSSAKRAASDAAEHGASREASGSAQSTASQGAHADAQQGATVSATADNVRLIGRTYEEDGVTWLPQSGSGIEFAATGTRVALEVVGDENVNNEPDQRPRFAVLVDGEVVVDDTLGEPSRLVEVALGDTGSGAVVEFMLLSESRKGAVGVRAITVQSVASRPVAPTAEKDLHIGFVGDSITCAYGVEAANSAEPFKTTTENFMKSYAYLTAKELDADYDTACYSGYGIVSGWTVDGTRNEGALVPPVYELVAEGHEQAWDFAEHPSDVVVVNLGTNDRSYTGADEARTDEFSQGYAAFLAQIRALNPDAFIVCTLGTMDGSEALYPALERGVRDYADRTGDARVICYLSEPMDIAVDGCGTSGHPNEVVQRKIAQQLVDVIRQVR